MVYVPRKCSATNRLIGAKDHASVQFNVGHVNADGLYTKKFTTFALSGYVRKMGESDAAVNRLVAEAGLMKDLTTFADSSSVPAKQSKKD